LVKACLIEHKTKWKPREFRITFPFEGDYFKVNTCTDIPVDSVKSYVGME